MIFPTITNKENGFFFFLAITPNITPTGLIKSVNIQMVVPLIIVITQNTIPKKILIKDKILHMKPFGLVLLVSKLISPF